MTIGDGRSGAPPGWYPDGPGWERRWDGFAWTADRRPSGPPPSSPPPGYSPAGQSSSPPGRRKGSPVWLWVALSVVAVVVVTAVVVTLVIVAPWADDDPSKGAGGDPTSEPTDPTDSPDPEEPVTGDLDGDGRGDVVGRFYDETESRLTLTNADGSFTVEQVPVLQEEQLVVGDFDGDGANDIGAWIATGGTLQFEIEDGEVAAITQDFDVWFKLEAVKAAFGDFDGDGLTDIAAYGQQHRSQVAVWVLRNNGDGFEQPEKWAALPNATYGSTELIVGDYNGDGIDDAMAIVPDEPLVKGDFDSYYWYGDYGVEPLIASNGSFQRGGVVGIDVEVFDQEYAVGDFDGDGTDTLVADDYYSDSLVHYEYDGTTLRPTGEQVSYGVAGDGALDSVVAVDVDGDRLDDLVFTSVDVDTYRSFGAWVVTADAEGGMDAPVKWADLPACSGDYCDIDFFAAR